MATFKVVISDPKKRKAYQKEVEQANLLGKKLGESFPGALLGLEGYTLEITGGSDGEGFPMRKDVDGSSRKRIILSHPPGFHPVRSGQRKRKSIRGNTISHDIIQINTKVLEYGKKSIEELLGIKSKEEPKKEEKPSEAPKEESKKEDKAVDTEKAEKKMGVKKLE